MKNQSIDEWMDNRDVDDDDDWILITTSTVTIMRIRTSSTWIQR